MRIFACFARSETVGTEDSPGIEKPDVNRVRRTEERAPHAENARGGESEAVLFPYDVVLRTFFDTLSASDAGFVRFESPAVFSDRELLDPEQKRNRSPERKIRRPILPLFEDIVEIDGDSFPRGIKHAISHVVVMAEDDIVRHQIMKFVRGIATFSSENRF